MHNILTTEFNLLKILSGYDSYTKSTWKCFKHLKMICSCFQMALYHSSIQTLLLSHCRRCGKFQNEISSFIYSWSAFRMSFLYNHQHRSRYELSYELHVIHMRKLICLSLHIYECHMHLCYILLSHGTNMWGKMGIALFFWIFI